MPSDASIYSMIRTPQQELPLDVAGKAMQIRALMNQNALSGIQQQQAGLQLDEQQKLRSVFANNPNPTIADVMAASPTAGMNYQKFQLDKQKTQTGIDKDQAAILASKALDARNTLAGVTDQNSYDQWRQYGAQKGYQVAVNAPPQFDPEWKNQHLMTADAFLQRIKPNYQAVNTGGATQVIQTNPLAPGAQTTPLAHTISPAEQAGLDMQRKRLQITAATNDPFGMLGIKDLANGGQAPAAPGVTPQSAATGAPSAQPTTIAPPSGVKSPPIQQGDWQKIMGTDVHGQDFLSNVPGGLASQIKAYAEGRLPFPSGFALKSPYFQAILQMVGQYDPSFDAVNYNARNRMRSSLASTQSGSMGGNLTKINTAIGHLDSFDKAAQAMDNGDYPGMNKFLNWIGPQVGDTSLAGRMRTFEQAKEAVSNELMSVFRGTGAASSDTAKWAETFNAADSPKALRSAVTSAVSLLKSRIEAITQTYQNGMGTTEEPLQMVYPKAAKTLARLESEGTGSVSGNITAAKPIQTDSLPDPAKYSGKLLTDSKTNTKYISNGKTWVRQ